MEKARGKIGMAKKTTAKPKKVKPLTCKNCKSQFEVGTPEDLTNRKKEWTMVSPMPDKDGMVTITAMASWNCYNCGKNITGSYGKTKGDFEGKSKKDILQNMLDAEVEFNIAELAEEIGFQVDNVAKMVDLFIKKGKAKGKVVDGTYYPN